MQSKQDSFAEEVALSPGAGRAGRKAGEGNACAPENFVRAAIDGSDMTASQSAPAAPDPGWSPDLPPLAPGKNLPEDW